MISVCTNPGTWNILNPDRIGAASQASAAVSLVPTLDLHQTVISMKASFLTLPLVALFTLPLAQCAVGSGNLPSPDSSATEAKPRDLAGSVSCRECHEPFYQLWATSHHGRAMQPYSMARTNLSEPKAEIQVDGCGYRADIVKGVVIAREPGGEKRYPMEQAMGGKNVFYFLTPMERGRLQVLPVAYDLRRREWFDTAGSAVRHFPAQADAPLRWTDPQYTFNTSCHSCHVSQLTNNYNLPSDTYHTTWAEPGINCETCHGPCAEHVKAARQTPKGRPLKDTRLISYKSLTPEQANSLCASCHSKMTPLTGSFSPGDRFFDHFSLAGIEQNDFYPDGRDLGENFTYTSWRQSPCLKSGKLTCVACHTSSGRYRFTGDKANEACLPCHQENVRSVAAHSHHPAGSPGAQCVSCHMPMTEFARMRRSDHSMRPPTPAATLAYGSPNACNLCHTNQDAAWADRQVRQWHKDDYQAPVLQRAALIAAARKRDWSRLPDMVKYLTGPERGEIQAAALIQLLRGCEDEAKWAGIKPCLADASPLVRAAAVEALGDPLRPETIGLLLGAVRDEFRLVRVRAAAALAAAPADMIPDAERRALNAATGELLASYQARPDDPGSANNLGNFHLDRREWPEAITAFETAARLRPNEASPLINLALACNLAGRNDKAEASLRRALRLEPTNAVVLLNLGMLLAEMDKPTQAEQAFRDAFRNDPQSAQAAYNLGVLLAKDRPDESLSWCRRAAELRPQEPRYAYTLAFFQNQQGKTSEAVSTLEKLIQLEPPYADAYTLLSRIYEGQNKISEAVTVCRRAAGNPKLSKSDRLEFEARGQALSERSAKPR
jgi:tetratricopeptide (TPR) repeat protein